MFASQRALPIVWPAFSTSSFARTSMFFSTTEAKLRSNLARSPGATFFQVSKAFCDLVIAATVSSALNAGTAVIFFSVTGEITS